MKHLPVNKISSIERFYKIFFITKSRKLENMDRPVINSERKYATCDSVLKKYI